MKKAAAVTVMIGLAVILAYVLGVQIGRDLYGVAPPVANEEGPPVSPSPAAQEIEFAPPSLEDVPEGPLGEAILAGYNLVNETHVYADEYVGNRLSCTSCHAGAGLELQGSPLVGVTTQYPQYRPREGVVFTLEDRINGCMIRSMNGEPFPEDSEEMRAIIAYLTYISQDIPVGADLSWREQNNMKDVPVPDVKNGEVLYKQSCAACHAVDGSGTGANTGPALWGDNSFNDGAGMTRLSKMTAFIKNNMPPGGEGTLTDQQAADLAGYILMQERPEFPQKDKDFPKGGRPNDFVYKEVREQLRDGTMTWEDLVGNK